MTGETRSFPTTCGSESPLALQKKPASIWHVAMDEALPTALSLTKKEVKILFFVFYRWIKRKVLENSFQYLQVFHKRILTKIGTIFIFDSFLLAASKMHCGFFLIAPLDENKTWRYPDIIILNWKIILTSYAIPLAVFSSGGSILIFNAIYPDEGMCNYLPTYLFSSKRKKTRQFSIS